MSDLTGIFVTSILVWLKLTSGEKRINQAAHSTGSSPGSSSSSTGILYSCPLNSLCQCANLPNETYLHEINCHEASLYKFPEFLQNTLKHIEIQQNFLQTVDDETFQGLKLETLNLVDNQIQSFSDKSFNSMTHSLISLDISGNQFQSFPLESIRNIHTLSRLNAQRNHIRNLDGDWGNLVDSLRSIHVSDNSLAELNFPHERSGSSSSSSSYGGGGGGWSYIGGMTREIVDGNVNNTLIKATDNIPLSKTFPKLRKLVWLDLSGNRINHISTNYLPKPLVTLDLSRNIFDTFSENFLQHLHDLKILSFRDNLIENVLSIGLMSLRLRLEKLDLSLNHIDELPSYLFNGTIQAKAINFDKNFIEHIPAHTFSGIGPIVHMVLAFNRLHTIDIDAFASLEHTLEYLDLERNQLITVPEAVGHKLRKLRYLYLSSNHINDVSSPLPNTLRVLSLAGNNLAHMPLYSLEACTELSYLNIGYNKISEIQENGFYEWGRHLQTLLLRNNKITHLNYGSFNGLDSIKEISLSFNDIHYIHPNVFDNISATLKILELSFGLYQEAFPVEQLKCLTELIWLGLDNNNLKVISEESLATMKELSYINLSFNRIMVLPRNIFMAEIHRNLMDVDLSYNMISVVFSYTFDSLTTLQFINLAHNRIRMLSKHCFNNLPFLTYIDLTFNQLSFVGESAFSFLPSLLRLDLMHNHMESLSLNIFKHVSNESMQLRLNISHNRLNHLDGEIDSILYVYSIDASWNELTETNSFRFLGYSLRVLFLKHNNISSLSNHAFGDLEHLEVLDLSANKIFMLRRRSFQGLPKLQKLNLNNNHIDQLQIEQFSNLKNLRILNLANNRLKALPREVFLNTRIEYLNLENNQIGIWPSAAFSDIGFTLRNIQFASNQIDRLDPTMFINTQFLYDLNLAKNKLQILPDNTFSFLNNLTNLDISFNSIVTANLKGILYYTPRLRRLNLCAMGLYSMPNIPLSHIIELDLSANHLQEISPLNKLQQLRVLNVAQNKIVNLTNFGLRLPQSIRQLDISRNPIKKTLLHDLMQARFLEKLYMTDVKLSHPAFLSKLQNLKVLRLSSQINFGDTMAQIRGLQELYVEVNDPILDETLFAHFINHTKLRIVEITGTRLSAITQHALQGLARNQKLQLRITHTNINDFPPAIFYALRMVSQLSIDLSNNKIVSLAPDSFYPNASSWDAVGTRSVIGGLDLHGNPLQCDCGLVWLGHWLRRWLRETAQINAISKDEMKTMLMRARRNTCMDPITNKEMPFLEIFPEDLLCHASALSSSAFDQSFSKGYILTKLGIVNILVFSFNLILHKN